MCFDTAEARIDAGKILLMSLRWRGLLVAGTASLTAALVPVAHGSSPETTTPGVVYVVKAVLTNGKVTIARDKYTRHGVHRLPRGAEIRYSITNKGTKPYALKVWETISPTIRPGHSNTIFVNWQFRGTYSYVLLYRGKPAGPHGKIVIF
jgi:hypothetical protein